MITFRTSNISYVSFFWSSSCDGLRMTRLTAGPARTMIHISSFYYHCLCLHINSNMGHFLWGFFSWHIMSTLIKVKMRSIAGKNINLGNGNWSFSIESIIRCFYNYLNFPVWWEELSGEDRNSILSSIVLHRSWMIFSHWCCTVFFFKSNTYSLLLRS